MPTLLKEPPLKPTHEIFRVERILDPEEPVRERRRHKVIAVMPAYNAERTLAATLADIPPGCVDEIILVDDGSTDNTVAVAREMGLTVIVHPENRGYGGNQKTCYRYALEHGRRRRRHDPPRLPVRQPRHPARRRPDRAGHLRRGARQPDPLAGRGPARRHAVLQVPQQPLS